MNHVDVNAGRSRLDYLPKSIFAAEGGTYFLATEEERACSALAKAQKELAAAEKRCKDLKVVVGATTQRRKDHEADLALRRNAISTSNSILSRLLLLPGARLKKLNDETAHLNMLHEDTVAAIKQEHQAKIALLKGIHKAEMIREKIKRYEYWVRVESY